MRSAWRRSRRPSHRQQIPRSLTKARGTLLKRLEKAEAVAKSLAPLELSPFDEDALVIYSAMGYIDATLEPSYDVLQPTKVYIRGEELRNILYGPITPVHEDEHIKRYTRTSGEFELALGREPKDGDILTYEHVAQVHSTENYSREFGRVIEAWQRRLPDLTCPLKYEEGKLFRRLRPYRRDELPTWEEDLRIQWQERWLSIPAVLSGSDLDTIQIIWGSFLQE